MRSCDIPWLFPKISPGAPPHNHRTSIIAAACSSRRRVVPLTPAPSTRSHTIAGSSLSLTLSLSNVRRAPSSKSSRSPRSPSLSFTLTLSRRLHTPTGVPAARSNHDDDRRLVFHDFPVGRHVVVSL